MAIKLTAGSISKTSSEEWNTIDMKPVLQVIGLRTGGGGGDQKERYKVILSDGSFHQQGMLLTTRNELVTSQKLHKDSIVQLTDFVCNIIRGRCFIIIIDLNVILRDCDIIGDPKPFIRNNTPAADPSQNENVDEPLTVSSKECPSSSQTQSNKRKGRSSMDRHMLSVAKDLSKIAKMMIEKSKEDDMGACFEKLEKLGWGIGKPMYDTAVLLFGESADYRKLWLHLKPESCGNWARNAGSQFGLLG